MTILSSSRSNNASRTNPESRSGSRTDLKASGETVQHATITHAYVFMYISTFVSLCYIISSKNASLLDNSTGETYSVQLEI